MAARRWRRGGGRSAEREGGGGAGSESEEEAAVRLGAAGPQAQDRRVSDALAVQREASGEDVDERVPHEHGAEGALGEVPTEMRVGEWAIS